MSQEQFELTIDELEFIEEQIKQDDYAALARQEQFKVTDEMLFAEYI